MTKHVVLYLIGSLMVSICSAQTPSASFTSAGKCELSPVTFTDASTTPSGTIVKWHWDFGDLAATDDTSNVQNPAFTFNATGTFQITLQVWNSDGNSATSMANLEIFPKPNAIMDLIVPCVGSNVTATDASTVSGGGIDSRLWTIDGNVFTDFSIMPNFMTAGTYQITLAATTDQGCQDDTTVSFFQGEKPILSFSPGDIFDLCTGDSRLVTASGADNYIWGNGNLTDQVDISTGGTHIVTGFNGNQCFTIDSVVVTMKAKPTANAGEDVTISRGQTTMLNGTGDGSYIWSPEDHLSDPNSANPTANPPETMEYVLTVLGSNGCFDTDTVLITVDLGQSIPVHNMMTPNGDGFNDKWDLSSVPDIANAQVTVFNRWGWEIFTAEDYQSDWEGTYQGDPVPDGTYVYVIKFNSGDREPIRGTLEILRNTTK